LSKRRKITFGKMRIALRMNSAISIPCHPLSSNNDFQNRRCWRIFFKFKIGTEKKEKIWRGDWRL